MISSAPKLLSEAVVAAALSDHPTLLENLEFQAVGLIIVMGALGLLYFLCAATGWLFTVGATSRAARPEAQGATEAGMQAAAGAEVAADVPLPVIAAAVAAVVEGAHRVVEVKPVTLGWSLEGRRQLLTSHQLRR